MCKAGRGPSRGRVLTWATVPWLKNHLVLPSAGRDMH
jgi:hypothetical protein